MAFTFGSGGEQMALALRYSGPDVDDGAMGVYDVAANMVGMSDYIVAAAHAVYGDQSTVTAQVKAFNRGSFEIDLLFHLVGITGSVLAAQPNIPDLFAVVQESFGLFKFLKGEPPAGVTHTEQGTVHVENLNGDVTTVNIQALHLTLDGKAGEAVGRVVGDMLSQRAISSVSLRDDDGRQVAVTRDDAPSFRRIDVDKEVSQNLITMTLQVAMPGFRDGLKWKLSDGSQMFQAVIRDPAFLDRVDAGEPFRKGDLLDCEVLVRQWQSFAGRLRVERIVERVLAHRSGSTEYQENFDTGWGDDNGA